MDIAITYCTQWNYQPKAASLAAELKEKLELDATLIGGSGGVFDVVADEKLIFSKAAEGDQFPEHEEVIRRLQDYQAASS